MVRFNETRAERKEDTVDSALARVADQLPSLLAARGPAFLGSTGEIAIEPTQPYPEIDPITGEAIEEPAPPTEYYRVGLTMPLGSAPLSKNRRRR